MFFFLFFCFQGSDYLHNCIFLFFSFCMYSIVVLLCICCNPKLQRYRGTIFFSKLSIYVFFDVIQVSNRPPLYRWGSNAVNAVT